MKMVQRGKRRRKSPARPSYAQWLIASLRMLRDPLQAGERLYDAAAIRRLRMVTPLSRSLFALQLSMHADGSGPSSLGSNRSQKVPETVTARMVQWWEQGLRKPSPLHCRKMDQIETLLLYSTLSDLAKLGLSPNAVVATEPRQGGAR